MDKIAEIERLKGLRDSGALTEDEFAAEKSRLLRAPRRNAILVLSGALVLGLALGGGYALVSKTRGAIGTRIPSIEAAPVTAIPDIKLAGASVSQKAESRIRKIFDPAMLGAEVNYLDSIAGPPIKIGDKTRSYKIDDCNVDAETDRGKIETLGLELSAKCSFDLNKFFTNESLGEANRLTFGAIDVNIPGGKFTADCLRSCGNAVDPNVYLTAEGSHADNWHSIVAETTLIAADTLKAAGAWEDAMSEKGEDWIIGSEFNCDHSYDPAAHRAFRQVKVRKITISGLIKNSEQCPK